MAKPYTFHPLATILPLMEGAPYAELVADIKANGLLNPITLHDGKILDGRNRFNACREAGVEPTFLPYLGEDPAAYVLSQNLTRRHLGPSERAMVAARLATLKDGQRQVGKSAYVPTQQQAAQLAHVSERSVKSARVVLEHGTLDLQKAVDQGRVAVHFAEKAARETPEAQADFLSAVAEGKNLRTWQNNQGRSKRAAELAATVLAMPVGDRRWPVLLADPPWQFEAWNADSSNSHPEQHYPCMDLQQICALPIASLAADHCVLLLWTTIPCLEQAFDALRAWGFAYKSHLIWDKERIAQGYWVRGQHELLLIATKGKPPLPTAGNVPASMFRELRREHSRKPEISYAVIEKMFPTLPKLELFARQAREGWDVWGNETEKFSGAA